MKIGNRRLFVLLFSAILFVDQLCLPAVAGTVPLDESIKNINVPGQQVAVTSSMVEELTLRILRKELELERLNTVFRQQTTLTSPWRQRRMFAYGEGNACLTETGLLIGLPAQYKLANTNGRQSIPGPSQGSNLVAGARCFLIANAYGMGGDLLELGLNFVHYCSLRKKGFIPSIYRQNVHKLHIEIDDLIEQRRLALTAVSDFSSEDTRIAQAESKLLNDLRDLYLLEYLDYHAGCKKFWLGQNTAYIVDMAKNATSFSGNLIQLAANHRATLSMLGSAGVLTTISGVIILLVPLVGRVTGNISGLAARRIVSQEAADVHTSTVEAYSDDFRRFLAMNDSCSTNTYYGTAVHNRRSLYEDQEKIMLMRNRFLKKEQKEAHDTLVENIVFAGIVGPTKITDGTSTIIASWHYADNLSTAGKWYAAGDTTYVVGTGFNILETARVQAAIELSNWKLRDSDLLPSNQFNRRLRMLENMDSFLGK